MFSAIPINGETWLVCGGRDFADRETFDSAMSDLMSTRGMPLVVVHGGARGADRMAGEWAKHHALRCYVEEADWNQHGKAAGVIRNQAMLDKHKPDLVVAFPGGRGTADMILRAKGAGVPVAEIQMTP